MGDMFVQLFRPDTSGLITSVPNTGERYRQTFLPGNTDHFHWSKSGEYITQVTAIGPLGLEYVNSKDDPRNGHS
jgi:hypothetical protein